MGDNKSLTVAKKEKYDEFYTQYEDIEKELSHYVNHFKNKVVFCNCDDPKYSNFWRFFHCNFAWLGLKKIISTHYNYDGSPSYALTYEGGYDLDVEVGTEIPLKENGDFRSSECIEFLKEADIVVTNPPFSLLRNYLLQLIKYDKKFLIVGNPNALHYAEIFPYVAANKIWIGYKSMSADMLFDVSKEYADWLVKNKKQGSAYKIIDGVVKGRTQAIWYTNLDIEKRHQSFFKEEEVKCNYYGNEKQYPKYVNFDAIDVNAVKQVPYDYYDIMGVPDSFLNNYNPDEFTLIGISQGNLFMELDGAKGLPDSFINDYYSQGGKGALSHNHPMLGYYNAEGEAKIPFSRILIKRKD